MIKVHIHLNSGKSLCFDVSSDDLPNLVKELLDKIGSGKSLQIESTVIMGRSIEYWEYKFEPMGDDYARVVDSWIDREHD